MRASYLGERIDRTCRAQEEAGEEYSESLASMAGAEDSTNNTGVHNEEEKKPVDTGGGGAHINLKVKGQVGML